MFVRCLIAMIALLSPAPAFAQAVPDTPPDNSGPVKLLTASSVNGGWNATEFVGAQIEKDGTIALVTSGGDFYLLSSDGRMIFGDIFPFAGFSVTLTKMTQGTKGNLFVMGDAPAGSDVPGYSFSPGHILVRLTPDLKDWKVVLSGGRFVDFAVAPNGDIETLDPGKVTRYAPDGKTVRWTATFAAHGDDRPGGLAIDPATGITSVVGYGMTGTGHEPYKDPYAYGFDRQGKQLWTLWNPDPKLEAGNQFGGNGLMADTSGLHAASSPAGSLLLLKADGGNTVCTRDPAGPSKPLDPAVLADAFQKTAGYGFHGASATSVVFRVNPASGALERGTWMSAWLSPAHANALTMNDATGDGKGNTFVVGDSAYGCPTKMPWYTAADGGYKGGSYLAVFDSTFGLRQCGYFPGTSIKAVACRNGIVVIAGSVHRNVGNDGHSDSARLYHSPQQTYIDGNTQGYYAVLRCL